MTDHKAPTNADLMARLASLDEIAAGLERHEKRITALEADRAIVHRLADHLREVSGEVRVIHDLLSKSEDVVTQALRVAGKELSTQVTATVRAEMGQMHADMRDLRDAVEARPCLMGDGECIAQKETPDA